MGKLENKLAKFDPEKIPKDVCPLGPPMLIFHQILSMGISNSTGKLNSSRESDYPTESEINKVVSLRAPKEARGYTDSEDNEDYGSHFRSTESFWITHVHAIQYYGKK